MIPVVRCCVESMYVYAGRSRYTRAVTVQKRASKFAAMDTPLEARVAACEEAEAMAIALGAKLSVLRDHLEATKLRVKERDATAASLVERAEDLAAREHDSQVAVELIREGNAACDQRITLTKQLIQESARKIEALRARGGVAEEMHREKTIQLGVVGERLLERGQQLRAMTLHCMEQRLRVGLEAWLPMQRRAEALAKWREAAASRREKNERLLGAAMVGAALQDHSREIPTIQ